MFQWFDVIFCQADHRGAVEYQPNRLCISRHLLLIASFKLFDFSVGEQPVHLTVGQFAAFNPRGRTDAFNRATRRRADRRSGARVPRAFHAPLNSSISAMRERISGARGGSVVCLQKSQHVSSSIKPVN